MSHVRLLLTASALVALVSCSAFGSSGCDPTSQVDVKHDPIPTLQAAKPSFDALEIDQAAHLLYVADRSDQGIDVFDVSTPHPAFVRTVPVGSQPNGLALAPELGKLYAGLEDGNLAVLALGAQPVLMKKVNVKAPADLLEYVPNVKKIYAGTADSVAVVDAGADTLLKSIKLQKGIEQPRWNPADGLLYVAGHDQNAVYVVDPRQDRLLRTQAIEATCKPAGIAINPKLNQGLLACTSTQTLVWDFKAAHRTTIIDQVTGGDIAIYDARAGRFFVAEPGAKGGPEIAIYQGSPIRYSTAVGIDGAGSGVAYDETNGLVYTVDQRAGKGGIYSFKPPVC